MAESVITTGSDVPTDVTYWAQKNIPKYGKAFKSAHAAAGQDVWDDPNGQAPFAIRNYNLDTKGEVYQGILSKAVPFQQEFQKAYGRAPTESELTNFMDETLTPTYALDYLNGTHTPGVKEYIANAQNAQKQEQAQNDYLKNSVDQAQKGYSDQNSLIDQQAAEAEKGTRTAAEEAYGQEVRRQGNENAAVGRLSQPVFQENVNRNTQAYLKNLGNSIAQIRAGTIGAKSSANQSLLDRLQSSNQFAAGLGTTNRTIGLQEKQMNINNANDQRKSIMDLIQGAEDRRTASALGRAQADANKPGMLDYVNTGFQGLTGLGTAALGIAALKKK